MVVVEYVFSFYKIVFSSHPLPGILLKLSTDYIFPEVSWLYSKVNWVLFSEWQTAAP
jgi:hypothetical protein